MKTYNCHVLVIGGGVAGMRAVVAAQQLPVSIIQIVKGKIGFSGASTFTVTEAAGFGVADGRKVGKDSPDIHYEDILEAGRKMADPIVARTLVDNAPETIAELEGFGVDFEQENGEYLITQGCFGSIPRNYNLKAHGSKIVNSLHAHYNLEQVTVLEGCMVVELIVNDNKCLGAIGLQKNGEYILIKANSTILAGGGAGQIFKYSLNPNELTGDSYALGYKAGAKLMNMEFMQIGNGILWPGFSILNSWIWSLYPSLTDKMGNSVIEPNLPGDVTEKIVMKAKSTHYPFSSRSVSRYVEVGIQKALTAGNGGPHGGVFLDAREVLSDKKQSDLQLFQDMWKLTNEWYLSRGIDVSTTPIEVANFSHAFNGGLKIDASGKTSIESLFAAGEAASGPHGADRLGGNMLVTCVVFGKLCGINAANEALKSPLKESSVFYQTYVENFKANLKQQTETTATICANQLLEDIRLSMWKNLMVIRSEKRCELCATDLAKATDALRNVKYDYHDNPFILHNLENTLIVSKMVLKTSQRRKESRGSHYREDYPHENEEFDKPFIFSKADFPLD